MDVSYLCDNFYPVMRAVIAERNAAQNSSDFNNLQQFELVVLLEFFLGEIGEREKEAKIQINIYIFLNFSIQV